MDRHLTIEWKRMLTSVYTEQGVQRPSQPVEGSTQEARWSTARTHVEEVGDRTDVT